MSSLLKLRRGSTVAHETFTGADGEVTFNTDTNALVTHDGTTAGGFPHVKASDLSAASGAALVKYTPSGVGAQTKTVEYALQEHVSVFDFMTEAEIAHVRNRTLTLDMTSKIRAAIAEAVARGGVKVFLPYGSYRTTELIYLGSCGGITGEGNVRTGGSQFSMGGSSIYADHAGSGVLSLKGSSHAVVSNLTLEARQFDAPKTGLILGRNTTASAGNHSIEKVTIRGNYKVSCIYSIASEEVRFSNVECWLYAESTGFACYYSAESDVFAIDSLVTSTNIAAYFYGCSFINSPFDDADPLRSPSVVYLDAGGQTGSVIFNSCYLVPNAGAYITINNVGSPGMDLLGPFMFMGVNGERLGESGDPSYGLRIISATALKLRGLVFIGSRFNFLAGTTKKAISISNTIALYNPNVVINPEEAFEYATHDVNYNLIRGGVFSIGREGHWKPLVLEGTWINPFGAPYQTAEYRVGPDGKVFMRGEIAGGSGHITTLPIEARPAATNRVRALSGTAICLVSVNTLGVVNLVSGDGENLDLSTINFCRN